MTRTELQNRIRAQAELVDNLYAIYLYAEGQLDETFEAYQTAKHYLAVLKNELLQHDL